jgi:hypothetical protein
VQTNTTQVLPFIIYLLQSQICACPLSFIIHCRHFLGTDPSNAHHRHQLGPCRPPPPPCTPRPRLFGTMIIIIIIFNHSSRYTTINLSEQQSCRCAFSWELLSDPSPKINRCSRHLRPCRHCLSRPPPLPRSPPGVDSCLLTWSSLAWACCAWELRTGYRFSLGGPH